MEEFARTELLLGEEAMEKLKNSRVAVFGIGGVGGHVVEALVRSGIGTIDLVDSDTVAISNINRQLIATHKTVGWYKVDAMRERILEINPTATVNVHKCFFLPETEGQFEFSLYDYVVDAVDTVTAKIALVMACQKTNTPIISSMGAGNKLNPTMFEVADLYKTSVCPLAKVMRRELKKRNIKHLKVVYSKEEPLQPLKEEDKKQQAEAEQEKKEHARKVIAPGSIAFVPSVVGLILAGEVIKDLTVEERV